MEIIACVAYRGGVQTLMLAEELVLLAYDDEGVAQAGTPALDCALAGAVLMDLTLAGRITVAHEHVVVADPTPIGVPVLDDALAHIADDPKRRLTKHWIEKLQSHLRDRILDGLVAAGVLEREKDKVLWVFPRTRYPSPHGVEPPAETDVRHRLTAAIDADGPVEARTAALCALVRVADLDKKVFAELPRDRVKARLAEISEGDWAATATKKAIEDMEAAVVVAIMVPIIASTAAGT